MFYQAVVSIVKGNKDFSKALEGPMYDRIRQAVHHHPESTKVLQPNKQENEKTENIIKDVKIDGNDRHHNTLDRKSDLAEGSESQTLQSLEMVKNMNGIVKKKTCPRPDVEHALSTLDRVIHAVKEFHVDDNITSKCL